MCPAIHINSRSWLRSSSTREPSDPPLRVVSVFHSVSLPIAEARHDDSGCFDATRLVGQRTVRKIDEKTIAPGRPKYDRRLFKPSQCRLRRHTGVGAPSQPARSSRQEAQSRQVPRHFNRVFTDRLQRNESTTRSARFSRRAPAVLAERPNRTSGSQSVSVTYSHTRSAIDACVHHGNDPSAGSPTETLLRLLLPLDDQV